MVYIYIYILITPRRPNQYSHPCAALFPTSVDSESGKTTPVVSALSDGPHVNIVPKQAKTKRKPEAAAAAVVVEKPTAVVAQPPTAVVVEPVVEIKSIDATTVAAAVELPVTGEFIFQYITY